MANTLEDLREHLFATLDALRNKDQPMEIDRARAISEVAKTVIDSAKAEVDYLRVTGKDNAALPVFKSKDGENKEAPALPPGVVGVRTHLMKG